MDNAEKIRTLQEENAEMRREIALIKEVFSEAARSLGLEKIPPEKITPARIFSVIVPRLMEGMAQPGKLEKDFSFFKKLLPLIEKYKD